MVPQLVPVGDVSTEPGAAVRGANTIRVRERVLLRLANVFTVQPNDPVVAQVLPPRDAATE